VPPTASLIFAKPREPVVDNAAGKGVGSSGDPLEDLAWWQAKNRSSQQKVML